MASSSPKDWAKVDIPCDILVGCDGGAGTFAADPHLGFSRTLQRSTAGQMIGVTFNVENTHTRKEIGLNEISLKSYADAPRFERIKQRTGAVLENLVYYREHSHHYFVFTPKRESLLSIGVLRQPRPSTAELLARDNVDDSLLAKLCQQISVECGLPPGLKFARDLQGRDDRAIFDFSQMYRTSDLVRLVPDDAGGVLFAVVCGDALVDPFWPDGTGVNRVVQSVLNFSWYLKQWAVEIAIEQASGRGVENVLAAPESVREELSKVWTQQLGTLRRCHFFKGDRNASDFLEPLSAHTIDPKTRFRFRH
jgi:F-actin monooxygenase